MQSFNEDLTTNAALIRSRIKSPQLIFEAFEIGESTKTAVIVLGLSMHMHENVIENVEWVKRYLLTHHTFITVFLPLVILIGHLSVLGFVQFFLHLIDKPIQIPRLIGNLLDSL